MTWAWALWTLLVVAASPPSTRCSVVAVEARPVTVVSRPALPTPTPTASRTAAVAFDVAAVAGVVTPYAAPTTTRTSTATKAHPDVSAEAATCTSTTISSTSKTRTAMPVLSTHDLSINRARALRALARRNEQEDAKTRRSWFISAPSTLPVFLLDLRIGASAERERSPHIEIDLGAESSRPAHQPPAATASGSVAGGQRSRSAFCNRL